MSDMLQLVVTGDTTCFSSVESQVLAIDDTQAITRRSVSHSDGRASVVGSVKLRLHAAKAGGISGSVLCGW